jgi:hypothetical protein
MILIIIMMMIFNQITSLIARCRDQSDVDKQILILHAINSALPKSLQLKMPSLLTNDYVSKALDIIEDRILLHRQYYGYNTIIPMPPLGQPWKIVEVSKSETLYLVPLMLQTAATGPINRTKNSLEYSLTFPAGAAGIYYGRVIISMQSVYIV